MLNLRVVRGPLPDSENETILREYNRLTSSAIPLEDYRHWVQGSPDGPVYHALLQTDEAEIAGHMCLIPIRVANGESKFTAAKAEYFFVREAFRTMPVRGFEGAFKPAAILLLDQLYRHCKSVGWGPFFISADPSIHPLHMLAGCRPMDLSLQECLFLLRPWLAARTTPNLSPKQRAAFFLLGLAQKTWWLLTSWTKSLAKGIKIIPVDSSLLTEENENRLTLFPDKESVCWRYSEKQYLRFASGAALENNLVAKRGLQKGYLRVCDWDLGPNASVKSFAAALLRRAQTDRDLGVRWAIYGNDESSTRIISGLRKLGFVCAPRVRRLLLHTKDPSLLHPKKWWITDSLFNFDQ